MTLQPIRRFGLDVAIIFRHPGRARCIGPKVWFEEGEGPKLEALTDPAQFGQLCARLADHLAPVYRCIARRAALPGDGAVTLGAPFTLACYMIEGGGSRDFAKVKEWGIAILIPSAC